MDKSQSSKEVTLSEQKREANVCMGIGAGVGAVGVGSAVALGATCPLCFIVAPALIAVGSLRRYQIKKKTAQAE